MQKISLIFIILLLGLSACSITNAELEGTWHLVRYGAPNQPTTALPGVETFFELKDGRLNGNVGCNSFGGEYKLGTDVITFSAIMSTEMYCEQTSGQEQAVLGMLAPDVPLSYTLDGDRLTITAPDGTAMIELIRQ